VLIHSFAEHVFLELFSLMMINAILKDHHQEEPISILQIINSSLAILAAYLVQAQLAQDVITIITFSYIIQNVSYRLILPLMLISTALIWQ
jgi:hypothetical protein